MPCDTVANGTDPAFTNYMNDLRSRPRQLPSARSLLLIATSAPLMIINRFADRHIPFSCHRTTFHGLTRAMLLEEIRRTIILDSGHRVDRVDYHFFMKLAAVRADREMAATTSVSS